MKIKRFALYAFITGFVVTWLWLLWQLRYLLLWGVYVVSSPQPVFHPFPLGQGKELEITTSRTWISKPYEMGLRIEASKNMGEPGRWHAAAFDIPYDIQTDIYRLEDGEYVLYHSERLTDKRGPMGIHGAEPKNPQNEVVVGYIYATELPAGQYKIHMRDHTPPHPAHAVRETDLGFFVNIRLQ